VRKVWGKGEGKGGEDWGRRWGGNMWGGGTVPWVGKAGRAVLETGTFCLMLKTVDSVIHTERTSTEYL
jgi:hypothetical protein